MLGIRTNTAFDVNAYCAERNYGRPAGKAASSAMSTLDDTDFFKQPDHELTQEELDKYAEEHRVVDVYLTDVSFLYEFFIRFVKSLVFAIPDDTERCKYIKTRLLYGIAYDKMFILNCKYCIFDNAFACVNTLIYNSRIESLESTIKREWGSSDMKFAVVVANPPYGGDMYIDFALKCSSLATKYNVWITPAKWQAKVDLSKKEVGKNAKFREEIVPLMQKIVYFPTASDVFDGIRLDGGVTYFMFGKTVCKDKEINGIVCKDWKIDTGFDLNSISIINKVLNSPSFVSVTANSSSRFYPCKSYFSSKNFGDNELSIDFPVLDPDSPYILVKSNRSERCAVSNFKHTQDMDKYKVYINLVLTNKVSKSYLLNPNEAMCRGSVLLGFGTKDECESVKSYYGTKFIWFLTRSKLTGNANTATFANVPMPDSFNKIFEDRPLDGYTPNSSGEYYDLNGNLHCSLYVRYGLTDEEIDVIEQEIIK